MTEVTFSGKAAKQAAKHLKKYEKYCELWLKTSFTKGQCVETGRITVN